MAETNRLELTVRLQTGDTMKQLDKLESSLQKLANGLIGLKVPNSFGKISSAAADSVKQMERLNRSFSKLQLSMAGLVQAFSEAFETALIQLAGSIGTASESLSVLSNGFQAFPNLIAGMEKINKTDKTLVDFCKNIKAMFGEKGQLASIGNVFAMINDSMTSGLEDIGAGIGLVLESIVQSVTGASVTITVPIAGVIAIFAGVSGALIDLWNTSEGFRDSVGMAFTMVRDSITGAFQTVQEAVEPFFEKLQGLGSSLYALYEASGLKSIVELIATLGAHLLGIVTAGSIDLIAGMFSGLVTTISGVMDILSGFADVLSGIFTMDKDKIFEGIYGIFKGITEFFGGQIDALVEVGYNLLKGLLEGMLMVITDIGEWLGEYIFGPIVNGIKSLFGIHSPSTVMEEIGGFLMEGLLGGITSLTEDVVGVFSGIGESIGEAWDTITTTASDVWEGLTTTVSGFWDTLSTTASKKFASVKEVVNGAWEGLTETASDVWGGLTETVGGFWDWLTGKSGEDFQEIKKNTEDSWINTEGITSDSWNRSKEYITDALSSMKSETSASMEQIFKCIESYTNSIWNITANNWDVIGRKVSAVMSNMSNDVGGVLNNIIVAFSGLGNRIKNSMGDLYGIGRNAAQAFGNGFKTGYIATPHLYIERWKNHSSSNGSYYSVPEFGVQWYGAGGFPNAGEMFIANENGPEMIGKMGHRNVVANNKQITDGIRRAVVEGMLEAAMAAGGARQDSVPYIIHAVLKTESDEVLARSVERGRMKRNERYNAL